MATRMLQDSEATPERAAAVWQDAKQRLEEERAAITAEIRSYPPPIPACDQQYNHLLEQRRCVLAALRELETLRPSGLRDL